MWSSSANSSILRHISSVRPVSNMFLRNFSSRMNRSWDTQIELLFAFLLERIRDVILAVPMASSRNGARGVALSLCSSWESRRDPWCTGQISCSPLFRFARSARTCNRTMPTSQYDRHTLHCALGSVSSKSHNSIRD